MYLGSLGVVLSLQLPIALGHRASPSSEPSISYDDLPSKAIFPGPWDTYIQAPANKTHIHPNKIFSHEGDVSSPDDVLDGTGKKHGLILGPGGTVTIEWEQNIAGRYA